MRDSPQQRTAIWLWPNLLGLDAPLVAVTWQAFAAICFAVPLRPVGRIVLGLTVWAIYLADRLLDVRGPAQVQEAERHRFHRRHKRVLILLLGAALLADVAAVLFWMRPAVFRTGLLPLAGVVLYLGVLHWQGDALRLPKELAVALLFTAGTFLVSWTFVEHWHSLLLPAISFLLLCLGNLVAIEMWEWRELRNAHGKPPHPMTIWLEKSLRLWLSVLAVTMVLLGGWWYLAIGLSAAAIVALHLAGQRCTLPVRRALVDAALLTPLPWILP